MSTLFLPSLFKDGHEASEPIQRPTAKTVTTAAGPTSEPPGSGAATAAASEQPRPTVDNELIAKLSILEETFRRMHELSGDEFARQNAELFGYVVRLARNPEGLNREERAVLAGMQLSVQDTSIAQLRRAKREAEAVTALSVEQERAAKARREAAERYRAELDVLEEALQRVHEAKAAEVAEITNRAKVLLEKEQALKDERRALKKEWNEIDERYECRMRGIRDATLVYTDPAQLTIGARPGTLAANPKITNLLDDAIREGGAQGVIDLIGECVE